MKTLLLFFTVFITSTAAADDKKDLEFFDVYASPKGGIGAGSYRINGVDDGKFATLLYGGKLGVKVGPLLLGGEYLEGRSTAESSQPGLSDSLRMSYPEPNDTKMRSIGISAGVYLKRVSVWANYFPIQSIKKEAIVAGQPFDHTYSGQGMGAEIMVRVWDNVHASVFYNRHEFKKYSSNHPTGLADNALLDPYMSATTFGINLSYLIPYSQIKKYIK